MSDPATPRTLALLRYGGRALQSLGAALAIVASILLFRIVHHGYTDHGHLDVFHLVVAIGAAFIGLFLFARAFPPRT